MKSSWELATMMFFDQNDDVVDYEYEPTTLELNDGRRAIPDFFVTFNDRQEYVEVKPNFAQVFESVKLKLDLVKQKVESQGYSYTLYGDETIESFKLKLGERFLNEVKRYQSGI